MHRSRFYGLFVDVAHDDRDASLAFWSAALGVRPPRSFQARDPYVPLPGALGDGLAFEVQGVGPADDVPRYHVDIETDDVTAETERLVGLGAAVVERRSGWTVLRAPGGHVLCVVPVQSGDRVFSEAAREWG